ncbi:MAG: cyanophycin synthetase, partial [Candidatus Latescibacteria bacterium]|nr:cyanophycin synthetase [Candidatus Latescibacterota bacterium]
TEIQAVLEVLEGWEGRRFFLVFQPHLYSRTSDLAEDFGRVLSHPKLHQCIVTDIFPSREAQMPGVTGKLIVDAAEAYGGRLDYIPDMNEVLERVKQDLQPGDVLMTMGAGNIDRLGDAFIEASQADI